MTIAAFLDRELRVSEARYQRDIRERVLPQLERMRTRPAEASATSLSILYAAAIAHGPAHIAEHSAAVAALLPSVFKARQRPEQRHTSDLYWLEVANLMACCGHADLASEEAEWLHEVQTWRNEPTSHFSKLFASLALGVPHLYRGLAGLEPDEPVPFTLGERPGPNLPGLHRHLAGAVEQRATFADVKPAWDEFLAGFDAQMDRGTLWTPSLFWVARIVGHQIAGRPLGEIAAWLHEYIVEAAAAESSQAEG